MSDNEVYEYNQGLGPLLISVPHAGLGLSKYAQENLNELGLSLSDTDWHVDKLCKKLNTQNINSIISKRSRYLIDLNRSSDNKPLYKGATTGLFPDIQFDGQAIWTKPRDATEDQNYLNNIWFPYHNKIKEELDRIKKQYGYALLLDLHSIKSVIPRLFDGKLPDLNIGTNSGNSCSPSLQNRIENICKQNKNYSYVMNGRFKGGFITREYGQPNNDCHAIQIEIARGTYMSEDKPFAFNDQDADKLVAVIQKVCDQMILWGKENYAN